MCVVQGQLRSKSKTKTDTISCDPEHQDCILGFMAFRRSHTYGMLAVAISKIKSSADYQESDAALTHVPKGRDAFLIFAFTQNNQYNIRITEERTALSEYTIDPRSIIAAVDTHGQPLMHSHWIMKNNPDHDDREQCESKIQEFAEHFCKYIDKGISHDKDNKYQPEQEQSSETKKRRHSTDHDEESMNTREDRSVKVKVKVTVEPPNPANVAEFNQEFQDIYLDREMSKADAAKELAEIQQSFTAFMERYHTDPKKTHSGLTDCELRSLAHVNPDENLDEDEFYLSTQVNVRPWMSSEQRSTLWGIHCDFRSDSRS